MRNRVIQILVFLSVLSIGSGGYFATRTGADPYKAYSKCSRCKYCTEDGETCGVCKKN